MFDLAEQWLEMHEVHHFMFAAKANNPLTSLASELGFDQCEVIYSKYIGDKK
jgi:hypothetical protein